MWVISIWNLLVSTNAHNYVIVLLIVNVGDNSGSIVNVNGVDNLQLAPETEQEVELLITDQETGISYSVSTQELLVERCLEDPQLLDALDADPLHLHDAAADLNDEIMSVSQVDATVNNYINTLAYNDMAKNANARKTDNSQIKSEIDVDDSLCKIMTSFQYNCY